MENSTFRVQDKVREHFKVRTLQETGVSAADIVDAREALEELVASKGWAIFKAHVAEEWKGSGYFARMESALDHGSDPKVVHCTAREVFRLLQWPAEQVIHLKGVVDE